MDAKEIFSAESAHFVFIICCSWFSAELIVFYYARKQLDCFSTF